MAGKKITIRDIATQAGVSPASVSMILNQKNLSRFSDETVKQVQKIAADCQYISKPRKHTEKYNKKNTKGIIMIICPSVTSLYYSTLIKSMEQKAIELGFSTIIRTTYWDKKIEKNLLDYSLVSPDIAGVIFAMIPQQPELARIASQQIPMVTIGDQFQDLGISTVNINNHLAGEMIGKHLIELGHQNVAYISTALNPEHSARVRRRDGVMAAYRSFCPAGKVMVHSVDIPSYTTLNTFGIEHEVGYQLAQKCARLHPEITAMVAINDMVAYGVIDGLHDLGLKIPDDISVCGFDNIFPSRFGGINLTTIEHSIGERGKRAFQMIADRLSAPTNNSFLEPIIRMEYECRLIVRGTTGPVKGHNSKTCTMK
ncbi:MAG: LacI family DNA-binding transcriptional regulator [Eubacteriales bacterium]|nr:LacI family DNA-binding transcriptional regulator [Eubacteriales bacterium]